MPAERERVLAQVSRAAWLFAGPGARPTRSASGTARPWSERSATSSTAAARSCWAAQPRSPLGAGRCRCTRSTRSEQRPTGPTGSTCSPASSTLPVAVIPHYDNAEGGTYDTRFCYLGEERLRAPRDASCPTSAAVLGVDEHTAVIVDLRREHRRGFRRRAPHRAAPRRTTSRSRPGPPLTIDELASIVAGVRHVPRRASAPGASTGTIPTRADAEPRRHLSMPTSRVSEPSSTLRWPTRDVDAAVAAAPRPRRRARRLVGRHPAERLTRPRTP